MIMEVLQYLLTAFGGAAVSGVPLYALLRKIRSDAAEARLKLEEKQAVIDAQAAKDQQAIEEKQVQIDAAKQINTEAEWKRIIEFRDAEVTRLRDRDNSQEKQILDIYNRLIESQRNEARKEEKLQGLEKQVERLTQILLNRCPDCPYLQLGVTKNVGVTNATGSPPSANREENPGVV
jgi:rubrerythrin